MIVVIGPSGAGKDTLLKWLKPHLEGEGNFIFAQRAVRRAVSSEDEDHISLSTSEFAEMQDQGQFCVVWRAHGLSYGVPIEISKFVRNGGVAVLNGSRRSLTDLQRAFPDLVLLHVTASIEVLIDRLELRGREDQLSVEERLQNVSFDIPIGCKYVEIDNSGPIEEAGMIALKAIKSSLIRSIG